MPANLWDDAEAPGASDLLAQRVYTSRLLGGDPSLVLHGGGNTSVKLARPDIHGREQQLVLVKGSGWDLATIAPAGFTPLLLESVRELAELDSLTDLEMARQLALNRTDPAAPAPSVEAIMHALLPYRYVDHTHADAIIALTNSNPGEQLVKSTLGDSVLVLPYVMPGFDLARLVAANLHRITADTHGIVLMNHGIVTFGDTARESYDRMIDLVARAKAALPTLPELAPVSSPMAHGPERRRAVAELRAAVSAAAGIPMIVAVHDDEPALGFAQRPDVATTSQRGPATPDHVIRTKPLPMLGRDVAAFAAAYAEYFAAGAATARAVVTMLDAAPRVILDPELGMLTVGRSAADAAIAEDIYRHTIEIIGAAEALGGYRALPPGDLFDVEYWDLEQAKLKAPAASKPLTGQVALVTGAASGIGKATAEKLLAQGAAVVGLDMNAAIADQFAGAAWLGVVCDVTEADQVAAALDAASDRFGGVDLVVVNAGIFPPSIAVKDLALADWQKVLRVNLDSAVELLREAHPLLCAAPAGGRVVVIGSKNVAAPGAGASAYSVSKAGLTQLARVLALEWAPDGIRVNVIHPDAVFDTGLWSGGVLEKRAANYGMTVDEYRTRNLLHVEITSADVAELVAAIVGPAFAKTTGAQVPIDGGNDRVV